MNNRFLTILLGVGSTVYNSHSHLMEPLRDFRSLLPGSILSATPYSAKDVHTKRNLLVLTSTLIEAGFSSSLQTFYEKPVLVILMPFLCASSKQTFSFSTHFLFYIHMFRVSSSYCFFCLARCGFRLLPSFR